jgi:hypothetical protein
MKKKESVREGVWMSLLLSSAVFSGFDQKTGCFDQKLTFIDA